MTSNSVNHSEKIGCLGYFLKNNGYSLNLPEKQSFLSDRVTRQALLYSNIYSAADVDCKAGLQRYKSATVTKLQYETII